MKEQCEYCAKGDEPRLIDGVADPISNSLKLEWCHSHEGGFSPCPNADKIRLDFLDALYSAGGKEARQEALQLTPIRLSIDLAILKHKELAPAHPGEF